MPRRRSTRLARHGAASATNESAAVLLALPPEVMSLIALQVVSGGDLADVVRMLATSKAWRAVCSAEAFWRELCLANYPRVRQILQHMPPPHPSWRQLFRSQRRAEKPQRSTREPSATPPHSAYLYTVEIRDDGGPAFYLGLAQPKPPLLTVSGRLESCFDCLRLWEDGDEPTWSKSIVRSYRDSGGSRARWRNSAGGEIASRLRVTCFVTRPSDHASFCLYDEFIGPSTDWAQQLGVIDEAPDVDIFEMMFPEATLPMAGAAALQLIGVVPSKVQLTLRLRSEGFHDDDDDPKYDPARDERGNLPGVGELEVRYLLLGGDEASDAGYLQNQQYLNSFAPF